MTPLAERQQVIEMAEAVAAGACQARACAAIELSARTLQRWQSDKADPAGDRRSTGIQQPKNRLSELERLRVLAANSAEFAHLPPSQIVPRLADCGEYIASESTFCRFLKRVNQFAHRSAERSAQPRSKPRALSATAPGELYSWDITYLPTAVRAVYLYLYLFMDIFSRKLVGWQVYDTESSELTSEVMRDICAREHIPPDRVVLHSDSGSPMKGATMLVTLQTLGVIPSFSRPASSNENPFSESLVRTLKYRPTFPQRPYKHLLVARQCGGSFVHWYNEERRHSAMSARIWHSYPKRSAVHEATKAKHPGHWDGATRNWTQVWVVHLDPEKPTPRKLNERSCWPRNSQAA